MWQTSWCVIAECADGKLMQYRTEDVSDAPGWHYLDTGHAVRAASPRLVDAGEWLADLEYLDPR